MGLKDTMDYEVEQVDGGSRFFKKGKIRVIIIYEDNFYNEFYVKNKEDYTITIGKRKYILMSEAIIKGKNTTLIYYFNNPMPIKFTYQTSKISALHMYDKKRLEQLTEQKKFALAHTLIDASTINSAMTSNLINKMFAKPWFTVKMALLIGGIGLVVILLTLHFTGLIDIGSLISGGKP